MYGLVFEGTGEGGSEAKDMSARGLGGLWIRSLLDDNPTEKSELKSFLRAFNEPVLPGQRGKKVPHQAASQGMLLRRW